MNLSGKKAVLVGASGGMGVEIAKILEGEGVVVIPVSRSAKDYPCDLTSKGQIKEVCEKIISQEGKIDLLFNAAGVGIYKTIEDTSLEDWDTSLAINLTAPFLMTKYLLPALSQSPESVVINFGSGMGTVAYPDRLPYCTSKFGLRGMSLSVAKEFKGTNSKIMLATLGSVLTEFGPMTLKEKEEESLQGKAYLTPQWVAEKLVSLLKNDEVEPEVVLYSADYAQELKDA